VGTLAVRAAGWVLPVLGMLFALLASLGLLGGGAALLGSWTVAALAGCLVVLIGALGQAFGVFAAIVGSVSRSLRSLASGSIGAALGLLFGCFAAL
jgi:hypothetical protein